MSFSSRLSHLFSIFSNWMPIYSALFLCLHPFCTSPVLSHVGAMVVYVRLPSHWSGLPLSNHLAQLQNMSSTQLAMPLEQRFFKNFVIWLAQIKHFQYAKCKRQGAYVQHV